MDYRQVKGGREFVTRMSHDKDWRAQIEAFAADEGLDAAFFYGLGAVQDAELYFYDQTEQEYYPEPFDEPLEVAACVGNLSLLDGEPFAHAHMILSRADGSTVAGHLHTATTFAGELYIRELEGTLEREHDPVTDLDLWPL